MSGMLGTKKNGLITGVVTGGLLMMLSACASEEAAPSETVSAEDVKKGTVTQAEEVSKLEETEPGTGKEIVEYESEAESKPADSHPADEVISEVEAKQTVEELMGRIKQTFKEQGEQYNWDRVDNPPDFDLFEPELLNYASEYFTDRTLREVAADYYCDCEMIYFPSDDLDIRFTLHEATSEKFIASSIEFINDMGNGGNTVYYIVIKEDGKWVIDHIDRVSREKEPMNVTWSELKMYNQQIGREMELLRETEYEGRKVFLINYPESGEVEAIYADNTDHADIPDTMKEEMPATEGKLTYGQAEQFVREHLEISPLSNLSVVYDHEDVRGYYVIRVYEMIGDHFKTNGWYVVDPMAQELVGTYSELPEELGYHREVAYTSLAPREAEELVREYMESSDLADLSSLSFVYDHENEEGHDVIHVYKVVGEGTSYGHTATYGWYAVDPSTGEVYDDLY